MTAPPAARAACVYRLLLRPPAPRAEGGAGYDLSVERSGQSVGGFGKLLPAHPRGQDKRYMSTTHRVDFDNQGGGGEPFGYTSYIAQRRNKSPRRRAAGAPPNGMPKGSRWSGATGEIFNCGADPQSNTAAQRSWMYTEDASFSVSEAEVRAKAESNDASYMSLPVGEGIPTRSVRRIPLPTTLRPCATRGNLDEAVVPDGTLGEEAMRRGGSREGERWGEAAGRGGDTFLYRKSRFETAPVLA